MTMFAQIHRPTEATPHTRESAGSWLTLSNDHGTIIVSGIPHAVAVAMADAFNAAMIGDAEPPEPSEELS